MTVGPRAVGPMAVRPMAVRPRPAAPRPRARRSLAPGPGSVEALEKIAFEQVLVKPAFLKAAHLRPKVGLAVILIILCIAHSRCPQLLPPSLVALVRFPQNVLGALALVVTPGRVVPHGPAHRRSTFELLLGRRKPFAKPRWVIQVLLRRRDRSARRNERDLEITALAELLDPPCVPHKRLCFQRDAAFPAHDFELFSPQHL